MPGKAGGVPMSPDVIEPLSRAMRGFGESLGKSAGVIEKRIKDILEEDKKRKEKLEEAAEAERILNNHYNVKDEFIRVSEGFRERTDYENFDRDGAKEEDRIRAQFGKELRTPREKLAFAQSFGSMSSSLRETLFNKKAQIITVNAVAAWNRTYNESIDNYIATDDPNAKENIMYNLELESGVLVDRGIIRPGDRDAAINKFKSLADEVAVRKAGLIDPLKAYGLLMDSSQLTNIDPIRRTQLTEHMESRVRMEGSRLDKLNTAIQRENQANALDDFALGRLDMDGLMKYRARDAETGQPGLSDAFFSSILEKVKRGTDSPTDNDVFNRLYTKDGLTLDDVEAEADSLSTRDERTLMRRVVSEAKEEERESRFYRRQEEAEERRAISEDKRIAKERRAAWARIARSSLVKSMNEQGMDAKEGTEVLKAFQGYVDDPSIAPEDLPDMVIKLMESKKGGVIKWFKGLYSTITGGESAKPELAQSYDLRPDKTRKGPGFLGELKRPGGGVSTEISIGVNIDGKETLIPTLVPTLSKSEIDYLLGGGEPTKVIIDKAVSHARKRMGEGKSPFKESEVRPTRKSLDDIFGGRKEQLAPPVKKPPSPM